MLSTVAQTKKTNIIKDWRGCEPTNTSTHSWKSNGKIFWREIPTRNQQFYYPDIFHIWRYNRNENLNLAKDVQEYCFIYNIQEL